MLVGEKILGAIATMVFKFLGLQKKSEYFMEAEPAEKNGSQAPTETKSTHTESVKPTEAKPAESKATPTKADAAPSAKISAPADAAKSAAAEVKKAAKSAKKSVSKGDEPGPVPEIPPAPMPKVESLPEAPATFAPNYLMPSNTPRRRPGPSLGMFKDMARQVNSSNNR